MGPRASGCGLAAQSGVRSHTIIASIQHAGRTCPGDVLIGVTRNQDLVPKVVRRRLSDSALMFVGFRIDEWDFRVLYRSLMNTEGERRRARYSHVAVQIDPEEGATIDAGRARTYLESYFRNAHVSLYWGSTEHFVKGLQTSWEARKS